MSLNLALKWLAKLVYKKNMLDASTASYKMSILITADRVSSL